MSITELYVGIDVSKATLDVCLSGDGHTHCSFDNTEAGVALLLDRLRPLAVARVVVESTGRYSWRVAADLLGAGLPVCVVNPRQVRDFAVTRR